MKFKHSKTTINIKICSREPFWEKGWLKGDISLLSYLWNGNDTNTKDKTLFMELFKTSGSWDTIEHKFSLFYSLSLHTQLLWSIMQQNSRKYNGTIFPPSGPIITQPDSQIGVNFDPFNHQHELEFKPSRIFFILPMCLAPFPWVA